MSPSNTRSVAAGNGGGGGKNYIEHQVSKMDTLAGVAIKYGVEVSDIKRMNGFATDLQMFALKTLKIPLPGRHSPSTTCVSPQENNTDKSSSALSQSNMPPPFRFVGSRAPKNKEVTTAMSTLQKYYGLKSSNRRGSTEGMEMAVYRSRSSEDFDDGLLSKSSPFSDSQSHHSMTRRFSVGYLAENGAMADYMQLADSMDGEGDKSDDKSVRRRQKAEVENGNVTPERMLKGETSGGSHGFSASTGKGLAMRPKSASRAVLQSELDSGWSNSIPVGLGESIMTTDEATAVRKSSSTPSLKEEENNSTTSVWPTSRWSLKTDLQALSNAASITRPIFDGLPKPITGRWKTALD
ncbi:uncharacterized protein LOC126794497 [Argentina anserina]|uniref:uncharacterized protein LOC126794497 n=1 Tax=Argentina anserina TaxID=57926 RepID=UPI0021767DC5|nr:uncharacterized protein LOC126794497 [Potentilla anserina]